MIPRFTSEAELIEWIGISPVHRYLHEANTSAGDSSTEERLIRLMVWVGAKLKPPPQHTGLSDPVEILNSGAGWCDQQVKVFLFLAHHICDVRGRYLELRHDDGESGHVVAEVKFDRSWRLFDVHNKHQTVYRNSKNEIASYEEIVRNGLANCEKHWWRGKNGIGKIGFYSGASQPVYTDYVI